MSNYLQQAISTLKETQEQVILRLLDEKRKQGVIKSKVEYQKEKERLLSKLEAGEPLTKVRSQSGLTDPELVNQTLEEINIDIHTSFQQVDQVNAALDKHQRLNQSVINTLQLDIKQVQDNLTRYEALLKNKGIQEVFYETFRDSNNFANESIYYTDRAGQQLSNAYRVKLDAESEAIKLPVVSSNNVLVNSNGVKLARIKITKQLGGEASQLQNPEHSVEKAIDQSINSFWSETIMMDAPIEINLGPEYYNLDHGAVCELEISFDHISSINEIALVPFTEYPLEIVAIKAYTSDSEEEEAYEILSPKDERDTFTADPICFQFPNLAVKRLRILLCQPHYIKTDFVVSDRQTQKLELAFRQSDHVAQLYPAIFQDKIEKDSSWLSFLEEVHKIDPSLDKMLAGQAEQFRPVAKYAYSYGMHNIAVRQNEYQPLGIYVSKPISVDDNIKTVSLKTTEEHPALPTINQVVTSIEYYITHLDNPTPEDWYPILPLDQHEISGELLFFSRDDTKYVATTRFPIKHLISVRCNGAELVRNQDYKVSDNKVELDVYDAAKTYTIDYTPTADAYTIDFEGVHTVFPGTAFEKVVPNNNRVEFMGTTRTGSIKLPHCPFVDKKQLNAQKPTYNPSLLSNSYIPIKVRIIDDDGNYIEQPLDESYIEQEKGHAPRVENATDYFQSNSFKLRPFDPDYPVYMYEVNRNEIRFNYVIPSTWRIIVEYPYLVSNIRLKAIMRRIFREYEGLTPIIKDYTIRLQTLQ